MSNKSRDPASTGGAHITFEKPRRRASSPAAAVRGSVDVAIITMRPDEFGAIHQRLEGVEEAKGRVRIYNVARVLSEDGTATRVALTRCLNQGPNEAQAAAEDVLEEIAPKWILLVGIAGGKPSDDFTLGDVVVSTRLLDFTVWAAQPKGRKEFDAVGVRLHPMAEQLVTQLPAYLAWGLKDWNDARFFDLVAPTVFPIPDVSSDRLSGSKAWKRKVAASLAHHFKNKPPRPAIALPGPTASSGALVKDSRLLQAWLGMARSALNVEMEFAGVLAAATRHDVPVLNIRGTSDIVGLDRDPAWTNYACQSAAALAVALTRSGLLRSHLSSGQVSFIDSYRTRMRGRFDIWDLGSVGVTQVGGASRPITAELDKMFLPLRLNKPGASAILESGAVIGPEEVLGLKRPLLIRGPAGSGKTTWSRWIFRRLIERPDVLPLLLTLRDLARRWNETSPTGANRSIDKYLSDSVREHFGTEIDAGAFDEFLKLHSQSAPPFPRLILIVDGWDELGPLGVELRDKLNGFLQTYQQVSLVVTSRPYGTTPPTGSRGFDTRDISPLSAEDISSFAVRFFEQCYGQERSDAVAESGRFWHALSSSPSALSLASTVLILTMMLLISRTRPLPDKRHRLYQECIENLLTALPTRRTQAGALLDDSYWCPSDSDERMRAVASLAFGIQARGDAASEAGFTIFSTVDELEQMLPSTWSGLNRRRFLSWLVGPSGILTDRSDGAMAFAHLSFQEYLAAWHLNATVEGAKERNATYGTYLGSPSWWETLLLWAALLASQSPERLRPILLDLQAAGPDGIALAGLIMADGLASEDDFQAWLGTATGGRDGSIVRALRRYAPSWRNSRQDERRQRLRNALGARAKDLGWVDWLRLAELLDGLGSPLTEGDVPWPTNALDQEVVLRIVEGKGHDSPTGVAVARALVPALPVDPLQLFSVSMLLLCLWPSHRVATGQRLQLAATCGADAPDVRALGVTLLRSVALSPVERRQALVELARSLPAGQVAPEWIRDFVNCVPGDLARAHLRLLANTRRSVRIGDLRTYVTGGDGVVPLVVAEGWAASLASSSGLDRTKAWLGPFAHLDLLLAAPCLRWALGFGSSQLPSRLSSVRDVCRRSLSTPATLRGQKAVSIQPPDLEGWGPPSVWEALFRVLGRAPRADDQALLEDFARSPTTVVPGMETQVKFIVRGDVLLRDGGTMALDEISDSAGEPRLPLVLPMTESIEFEMYFPSF